MQVGIVEQVWKIREDILTKPGEEHDVRRERLSWHCGAGGCLGSIFLHLLRLFDPTKTTKSASWHTSRSECSYCIRATFFLAHRALRFRTRLLLGISQSLRMNRYPAEYLISREYDVNRKTCSDAEHPA